MRNVFWKVDQDLSSDPALCRELQAHGQAAAMGGAVSAAGKDEGSQLPPLRTSASNNSNPGSSSNSSAFGCPGPQLYHSKSTGAGSRAGSRGASASSATAASGIGPGGAAEGLDDATLAEQMGPLADKLSVAIEVMYVEWRKAVDGCITAKGTMYRLKDELRDALKGGNEAREQCTLLGGCLEELRQQLLQSKVGSVASE